MQSNEPVTPCNLEAPQKKGILNRFLSLRAIWKLSIVELVFWVTVVGIAVVSSLL